MTELLAALGPTAESGRPLRLLQVAGTSVGGDWFHDQVTGLAGRGHIAALQSQRLGDTQARAVEQRHDCGVACPDPGIAVFAGAFVGIGETLGRRHRQRLRQAFADLWRADGGQRADPAPALAFQKPSERTKTRQRAH